MLAFALSSFLEINRPKLYAMVSFAERITEAVDSAKKRGLTVVQIAKSCGVTKQSVYQWMTPGGRGELEGTKLVALASVSGYSPTWIMTGKGPKLSAVSDEEMSMLHNWRQMNPADREFLAEEIRRRATFTMAVENLKMQQEHRESQ